MSDIVLVMIHVWEDDPGTPEVKWSEFGRTCALGANLAPWIKIWQFDFLQENIYKQHHRELGDDWHAHKQTDKNGRVPHRNVLIRPEDYISTSNKQTKLIIEKINPKIVLFGGLHKDLCVRGVLLDIKDQRREYLESDLLSFTWRETLKPAQEYDPAFA